MHQETNHQADDEGSTLKSTEENPENLLSLLGKENSEVSIELEQLKSIIDKYGQNSSQFVYEYNRQSVMAYRSTQYYTMQIFPSKITSAQNRLENYTLLQRLKLMGKDEVHWQKVDIEKEKLIIEKCDLGVITFFRQIKLVIAAILIIFILNSYWAFKQISTSCNGCYTKVVGGYGILDFTNAPPSIIKFITLFIWLVTSFLLQRDSYNTEYVSSKEPSDNEKACEETEIIKKRRYLQNEYDYSSDEVIIKYFESDLTKQDIQSILSQKIQAYLQRLNIQYFGNVEELIQIQHIIPIQNHYSIQKDAKQSNTLFIEIVKIVKNYEQTLQKETPSYSTLISKNQKLKKKLMKYYTLVENLKSATNKPYCSKYIVRCSNYYERELICKALQPTTHIRGLISILNYLKKNCNLKKKEEAQRTEKSLIHSRDINWKTVGIPLREKLSRRLIVKSIGFFQFFISAWILLIIDIDRLNSDQDEPNESLMQSFFMKLLYLSMLSLFYLVNEKIYEHFSKNMVSSFHSQKFKQQSEDLFFFYALTYIFFPLIGFIFAAIYANYLNNKGEKPFSFVNISPCEYYASLTLNTLLFFALKSFFPFKWIWSILVQKYYSSKGELQQMTQCQLNKIFRKRKYNLKNCQVAVYSIIFISIPFSYLFPIVLLLSAFLLSIQYLVFKYQFLCVFRPSFYAQAIFRSKILKIYIHCISLFFLILLSENMFELYGGVVIYHIINFTAILWHCYQRNKIRRSSSSKQQQVREIIKLMKDQIQNKSSSVEVPLTNNLAENEQQILSHKIIKLQNQISQVSEIIPETEEKKSLSSSIISEKSEKSNNEQKQYFENENIFKIFKESYQNEEEQLNLIENKNSFQLENSYFRYQTNLHDLISYHIKNQ